MERKNKIWETLIDLHIPWFIKYIRLYAIVNTEKSDFT